MEIRDMVDMKTHYDTVMETFKLSDEVKSLKKALAEAKQLLEGKENKEKMEKIMSNIAGFCPVCENDDIHYGKEYLNDSYLIMPATCRSCGTEFNEVYFLDFEKTEITGKREGIEYE